MLTAAGNGRIRDIAVSVDITHTFIGDLNVTLTSPGGSGIVLHDRSGGREGQHHQDLYARYHTGACLVARAAGAGTWRLRVTDLEGKDTGKLNRWALQIEKDA